MIDVNYAFHLDRDRRSMHLDRDVHIEDGEGYIIKDDLCLAEDLVFVYFRPKEKIQDSVGNGFVV